MDGVAATLGRGDEPVPDRLRGLDRDLLADDGPRQRRERIAAPYDMDLRIVGDQPGHHDVPFRERARRLVPVGGFGGREVGAGRHGAVRDREWYIGELFCGAGMFLLRCKGSLRSDGRNGVARRPAPRGRRRLDCLRGALRGCGGPEQGAADRVPHRRDGLRPRQGLRSLLGDGQRGDLRPAADLRVSGQPVQARADGGRSDARSRRRRAHLYVPYQEGRLFHARSGVQGCQAGVGGAGLRVLDHALHGPGEPLAVRVPDRRQDQGTGRSRRRSEEKRQVRLRRQVAGHGGGGPLHAALSPRQPRLQLSRTSLPTRPSAWWRGK